MKLESWNGDKQGWQGPVVRLGGVTSIDFISERSHLGNRFYWAYSTFMSWLNSYRVHDAGTGGLSINGQQHLVEMIIIGDYSRQDVVPEATQALVQQYNTTLILGPATDALTKPWAEVVHSSGALGMSPTAHSTEIFANRPNVFGILPPGKELFRGIFTLLASQINTVAYVMEEDVEGLGFTSMCESVVSLAAEYGLIVVSTELVPTYANQQGLTASVERLAQADPDIVFGCTQYDTCRNFIQESKAQGWSAKLHVNYACLTDTSYLEELGDDGLWAAGAVAWAYGTPYANVWEWTGLPAYYEDRYGQEPTTEVYQAWAAMATLLRAIESSSSTDPTVVAEALRTLPPVSTMFGPASADENGQNNATGWTLVQYQAASSPDLTLIDLNPGLLSPTVFYPMPTWAQRPCHLNAPGSIYGYLQSLVCGTCPDDESAYFNLTSQTRICSSCEDGTNWVYDAGQDDETRLCLSSCSPGWIPLTTTVGCQACLVGSYQSGPYCLPCEPGKYSPNTFATECLACPEGHFSADWGASYCEGCHPGYSLNYEGGTRCHMCHVGKYAELSGQADCAYCESGYVSEATGSTRCDICAAGRMSSWESETCTPCVVGKYQDQMGQSECSDPPLGSEAHQNETVIPSNWYGYWVHMRFDSAGHRQGLVSYEPCLNNMDACLEQQLCKEGHTGRQCLACLPGYTKEPASRDCRKCPNWHVNFFLTCAVTMGIICSFLFLARMTANARLEDLHAILFKQLVNHVVTLGVCGAMLRRVISNLDLDRTFGVRTQSADLPMEYWAGANIAYVLHVMGRFETPFPGFWSIPCLVMPRWDEELVELAAASNHSYYTHPDLAAARQEIIDIAMRTSMNTIIFLLSWTTAILVICYTIGYVVLHRHMKANRIDYENALEFYSEVYSVGFENVRQRTLRSRFNFFVESFHARHWGFWKPSAHMFIFQEQRRCDWRIFIQECDPIILVVTFVIFSPLMQVWSLGLVCERLFEGPDLNDDTSVLLHSSEAECHASNPVVLLSGTLFVIGGVVYPVVMLGRLWNARSSSSADGDAHNQWALFSNGYLPRCWWWETVVFMRKTTLFVVEVLPVSEQVRAKGFLIVALVACALQLKFSPYDGRCNRLLTKLEWGQLGIWVACAVGVNTILNAHNVRMMLWIPVALFTAHMFYVLSISYSIAKYAMAHIIFEVDNNADVQEQPRLARLFDSKSFWKAAWKFLKKAILSKVVGLRTKTSMREAYVALDPFYAWFTIVGNRGDLAVPTTVPKGSQVFHNLDYQPKLSEAPGTPEQHGHNDDQFRGHAPLPAGSKEKLEVQKSIATSVKRIIGLRNSNVFSVTLIDFIIRASFVLHYEVRARDVAQRGSSQEVYDSVMKAAEEDGDPFQLVKDVPVDTRAMDTKALLIEAKATRMEEELRKTDASILTRRQNKRQGIVPAFIREKIDLMFRKSGLEAALRPATVIAARGQEELMKVSSQAQSAVTAAAQQAGNTVIRTTNALLTTADSSKDTGENPAADDWDDDQESSSSNEEESEASSYMDREALKASNQRRLVEGWNLKYEGYADKMFSAQRFKRGVRLEDFQFGLLLLQEVPFEELTIWLDIFEKKWIYHRCEMSTRLRRLVLDIVDTSSNCEDNEYGRDGPSTGRTASALRLTAGSRSYVETDVYAALDGDRSIGWESEASQQEGAEATVTKIDRSTSLDLSKDIAERLQQEGGYENTEWMPVIELCNAARLPTNSTYSHVAMSWVRFAFFLSGGPRQAMFGQVHRALRVRSQGTQQNFTKDIDEIKKRREEVAAERERLEKQLEELKAEQNMTMVQVASLKVASVLSMGSSLSKGSGEGEAAVSKQASEVHPLTQLARGLQQEVASTSTEPQPATEDGQARDSKLRYWF